MSTACIGQCCERQLLTDCGGDFILVYCVFYHVHFSMSACFFCVFYMYALCAAVLLVHQNKTTIIVCMLLCNREACGSVAVGAACL